ncbi:MAG: selenium cofactor biosynthesis protein YqeC [Chloroflexota bacterium]
MDFVKAFRIKDHEVIALVGGGGKTTTLFRLGRELAEQGKRVLLTTTARLGIEQVDLAPSLVTFDSNQQTVSDILPALQKQAEESGVALLINKLDPDQGKAVGVSPETIDALSASKIFDVIINEADGAKKRPFKAPADHEPVIPETTTLVIPSVGLDALGQPLSEDAVFRANLIATLSPTALGQPITADTVVSVLTHPAGGLKHVPTRARVVPFLNKADLIAFDQARQIGQRLLETPRIEAVCIGSAQNPVGIDWVESRVATVILAAGQASRFGSPKQLALWEGKPLLARAVDTALASEASSVIVVLGAYAETCRNIITDRPVQIVENPDWQQGQSTSMKAGLAALPPDVGAAIFMLADQPRLTPDVLNALQGRYQQTLAPVVWPEHQGKRGNPILFDRSVFPEMQSVTGDTGAKPILKAYHNQAERVTITHAGILFDVDTPKDL